MIHSVELKGPSFARTIPLKKGLNLIYGERSDGSTERDTCNSLGKSSFLQVIDFCLGANADPKLRPAKGLLPIAYLNGWEFSITLDLFGTEVKAIRLADAPENIYVEGDVSRWPVAPDISVEPPEGGAVRHSFALENWRLLLGAAFFSLPVGNDVANTTQPDPPSYRQLFAYFNRKNFTEAENPTGKSKKTAIDKSMAYLLNLDWAFVSKTVKLEQEGKDANAVLNGIKVRQKEWGLTMPQLKKYCRENQSALAEKKQALESFRVDSQYHDKEMEADRLTSQLSTLRSRLVSNRRGLTAAKSAAEKDHSPLETLHQMYEEVGVIFPSEVISTLEATEAFHRKVTENRQSFLRAEITRLRRQIRSDEENARLLDERKSELLKHLSASGALDEYKRLQGEYESMLEDLAIKAKCISEFDQSTDIVNEVKEGKKSVFEESKEHFEHSTAELSQVETLFAKITKRLYTSPGSLGIKFGKEKKKAGFTFSASIPPTGGQGGDKMCSFCVDLTLLARQAAIGHNIDFLLHDGEILTSIEKRQRKTALILIDEIAREHNLQYITGINYDHYHDAEIGDALSLEEITALKLNDASPEGKLFGFSFSIAGETEADEESDTSATETEG